MLGHSYHCSFLLLSQDRSTKDCNSRFNYRTWLHHTKHNLRSARYAVNIVACTARIFNGPFSAADPIVPELQRTTLITAAHFQAHQSPLHFAIDNLVIHSATCTPPSPVVLLGARGEFCVERAAANAAAAATTNLSGWCATQPIHTRPCRDLQKCSQRIPSSRQQLPFPLIHRSVPCARS